MNEKIRTQQAGGGLHRDLPTPRAGSTCRRRWLAAFCVLVLTGMTACSSNTGFSGNASSGNPFSGEEGRSKEKPASADGDSLVTAPSDLDYTAMFTDRDSSTAWSATDAEKILLKGDSVDTAGAGIRAEGGRIVIESAGTYYITGTMTDGQIVIEAAEEEKVRLILDGADIHCSTSACILVKSADKVFVTLAKGSENTLSDAGTAYVQDDDSMTVDAVVFSKSDIVFNGEGSLAIRAGYQDGIVSKDDLKFTGGSYDITAAGKGIVGKDSLRIKDGTFAVDAQDDALHTGNDERPGKGFLYIEDGTFAIASKDDAVHAATALVIEGGTIEITECNEGLEGDTIDIDGGEIRLVAADDGLNAALSASSDAMDEQTGGGPMDRESADGGPGAGGHGGFGGNGAADMPGEPGTGMREDPGGRGGFGGRMDVQSACCIHMTGGSLYVSAEGDGIDSNGSIVIDGGSVVVDGPTGNGNGALDCGTEALINGGTVIAAGSSGMAETFSGNSSQYSILYTYASPVGAGTKVRLLDDGGKAAFDFAPAKTFSSLVLSDRSLTEGTYILRTGEDEVQIEVDSISTSAGSASGMMPAGPGMDDWDDMHR